MPLGPGRGDNNKTRSLSTGALMRFFGSIAIRSQGGREVSSGGGEGGTSHSSTGASTHTPSQVNGKGTNLGTWRKRDPPAPPVVGNRNPLLYQKGKSVVRVGTIEQRRLAEGKVEVRKAKSEGWRVKEGEILTAKIAKGQKLGECEIIAGSPSREPPNGVREVLSRTGDLKVHTSVRSTHPGPLNLSGVKKVHTPAIQQHCLHLTPSTLPSLYGAYMSQQLAQSCNCGKTSVPPSTKEAGAIEEV